MGCECFLLKHTYNLFEFHHFEFAQSQSKTKAYLTFLNHMHSAGDNIIKYEGHIFFGCIWAIVFYIWWSPPRGKRDGVIGHISRRGNMNWRWKLALLLEKLTWCSMWLDKLGVNINFRQFLSMVCAKNLCKSGMSSPPWGLL